MTHFVCIHGNFGSPNDWCQVTATLERALNGATFAVPDLWADRTATVIDELAAHLFGVKARGERVVVIGYSLGARLALELLARKDVSIDGAVLCSVNPGLLDPAARRDRLGNDSRWAEKVADLGIPWGEVLAEWNGQAVFAGSRSSDGPSFPSLEAERRVRSSIARGFREWSLGSMAPRWSTLETARCPVLCLAGEHDTKFRVILEAIERLPNPRVSGGVVPGAGHRIPLDSPTVLGARIALFEGARDH